MQFGGKNHLGSFFLAGTPTIGVGKSETKATNKLLLHEMLSISGNLCAFKSRIFYSLKISVMEPQYAGFALKPITLDQHG